MKHRRKLALVDLGYEFTGGTTYVQNLLSLLSGDAEIWLIRLSPLLTVGPAQMTLHIVDFDFALHWGRAIQIPLCLVVLFWLRVRHAIDTVWVNGYPEIALLPWAKMIGCRAIATRHLTLMTGKPRWHWIRAGWRVHFLYERLAATADKIVCVSEAVADSLKTCVPEKNLVVIHNWVPTLPAPVSPGALGDSIRLLFVGRLIPIKGVSLLLDALSRLKTGGAGRFSLTVVGEGDERADLEKEAAGLDVHFAGFRRDVDCFYGQADVFVNPTLGPEGLPLVSLDAMSYGLPCIFSDLPVHKEITGNGVAALLFEAGNAEDLKRKLELLMEAPHLIRTYGRLAREAVEEKHRAEFARRRYVEELGL